MDYKNGRIYKILNYIDDDIYVGSTCQPLSKRMAKHRSSINSTTKGHRALYAKMRELGVEQFYIELIEECPCDNKEQLHKREGELIREFGTLNHVISGRSTKEWLQDNHEHCKERNKQYYQDNKERRQKLDKEYRATRRDKIKEYNKEYYAINRERMKDGFVTYYENNKDKLLEKITCDVCGGRYQTLSKNRHVKTNKHQTAIE
jgi:hypothetical protein